MTAFLLQFAGSLLAVAALVAFAAWARIERRRPELDEAEARRLIGEDYPELAVERLWLAPDGQGAVARAGDRAVVLSVAGDGCCTRDLPWTTVTDSVARDGRVDLPLGCPGAPRVRFRLGEAAWPPAALEARS